MRRRPSPGFATRREALSLWLAASRHARLVLEPFGFGPGDEPPTTASLARWLGIPVYYLTPSMGLGLGGCIRSLPLSELGDAGRAIVRARGCVADEYGGERTLAIFVGETLSREEKLFIMGHELGHYFLEPGNMRYRAARWPVAWWARALDVSTTREIACDAFGVRLCMQRRDAGDDVRELHDAFERGDVATVLAVRARMHRAWKAAPEAEPVAA